MPAAHATPLTTGPTQHVQRCLSTNLSYNAEDDPAATDTRSGDNRNQRDVKEDASVTPSTHRTTRSYQTIIAAILATACPTACTPPSLLITPVFTQRELVETQLSRDSIFAFDKIALIDVSGMIQNTRKRSLLGVGDHPVSLLVEQLDKARRDASVKAVILRINSPGGTVVASELMHDEITHFKKTSGKPVIAVMMDVAASGGYYIACACDTIVAQPSTITGSIGVIMLMMDVSGTMKMIGIKSDAVTSGVHKDTGSPFREMRPEERELFQHIVDEMYDRFVKVVAEGRDDLDEQGVRRIADGRVYTASQALELGLIDRIATLRETIDTLKTQIKSKSVRVVAYMRPHDYRPNYYAQSPQRPVQSINLLNISIPASLTPQTPQFMYLWAPGY